MPTTSSAGSLDPRRLLRSMFDAAVAAGQPALVIPRHLPPKPRGRLIVIGAGKASAAMAQAVDAFLAKRLATAGPAN